MSVLFINFYTCNYKMYKRLFNLYIKYRFKNITNNTSDEVAHKYNF